MAVSLDIQSRRRLGQLPAIKRARAYRLYAEDGRRYIDFWQGGGRGILGARNPGSIGRVKSELDRGMGLCLPSRAEARLAGYLRSAFPRYTQLRVFQDWDSAISKLSGIGPWAVYRPFLPAPEADILLIEAPVAEIRPPIAALFRLEDQAAGLVSDLVSRLELSAAAAALAALRREETQGLASRIDGWAAFDRIGQGLFTREGPYLAPRSGLEYDGVFKAFLDWGLLLSPDPARPSIIPGQFDLGELRAFKECPQC